MMLFELSFTLYAVLYYLLPSRYNFVISNKKFAITFTS